MLYDEFGANAEYLIDHAWGLEPCTIADIHAYEPASTSLGNGQILPEDYTWAEARMVLKEMADATVLDLVEKGAVTDHVALSVGYASPRASGRYGDRAGASREAGCANELARRPLVAFVDDLYVEIADPARAIRRLNLSFGGLRPRSIATSICSRTSRL